VYFYHDEDLDNKELKKKYLKRGERLHNLLMDNKKILFIRKCRTDSVSDLNELISIIKIKYPNLNFKILLINNLFNDKGNCNVIHKYQDSDCFLNIKNDVFSHTNIKKSYDCVNEEVSLLFTSMTFTQPKARDKE
jgi:hypothetical protein